MRELILVTRDSELAESLCAMGISCVNGLKELFEKLDKNLIGTNCILVFDGVPEVFPGSLDAFFAIALHDQSEPYDRLAACGAGIDLTLSRTDPGAIDLLKEIAQRAL